jgi:hypothetical protein
MLLCRGATGSPTGGLSAEHSAAIDRPAIGASQDLAVTVGDVIGSPSRHQTFPSRPRRP